MKTFISVLSIISLTKSVVFGNNLRHSNNRVLMAVFPQYSQQCQDDAGPPFLDDKQNFVGEKYFYGKPANAIGDDCPDPLKGACASKPKVDAYLEGPLECENGWFCRIVEQPGWSPNNLLADLNFGSCNTTEGFNEQGFDRDGHCHGSDSNDAFYWWVRDHWFRGYNGRLRCCCGWNQVTDGGIVNNCDFRRLVTPDENLDDCRDANEDDVTPYRNGCSADPQIRPELNLPIIEKNSDQCWEVQNFGEPCDDCDNSGGSNDESCEDDPNFKYKGEKKKTCSKWVAKATSDRCKMKFKGKKLSKYCPKTCGMCGDNEEDDNNEEDDTTSNDEDDESTPPCKDVSTFVFKKRKKDCKFVSKKIKQSGFKFCNKSVGNKNSKLKIKDVCPVTCNAC